MKKQSILMIVALMLLSFGLFATNEMGHGGYYDGYSSIKSSVIGLDGVGEEPPLAVTLSSFTAVYSADQLAICWSTQSESNNAGWNIYRSANESIITCI